MHRHACSCGHYWDCRGTALRTGDSEPSVCICFDHAVPMEQGDHSACMIEVLACREHRAGQMQESDARLSIDDRLQDGFVPLQCPEKMEEMIEAWSTDTEPSIGLCLLCGNPIPSEDDLIPGTASHNCVEGRSLKPGMACMK